MQLQSVLRHDVSEEVHVALVVTGLEYEKGERVKW